MLTEPSVLLGCVGNRCGVGMQLDILNWGEKQGGDGGGSVPQFGGPPTHSLRERGAEGWIVGPQSQAETGATRERQRGRGDGGGSVPQFGGPPTHSLRERGAEGWIVGPQSQAETGATRERQRGRLLLSLNVSRPFLLLLPGISEPLSRDTGSSTCRSSRLFNGLQESSNQLCTCAVSQPSARTRYDWLKRSGLSAAGISEPLSRDTGSSTCRSSRLFNGLQESSNQLCTCAVSQPSARTRYDWLKRSGLSAAGSGSHLGPTTGQADSSEPGRQACHGGPLLDSLSEQDCSVLTPLLCRELQASSRNPSD
ncbi:UNVERIFIED_CONTAM: hypothetical protein FKN15_046009 [Acipenser sinensis]